MTGRWSASGTGKNAAQAEKAWERMLAVFKSALA